MKEKRNYYVHVGLQFESDVEAINKAAEIAEVSGEPVVELRRCGTKDLVCLVTNDGNVLFKQGRTES